MKTYKILYRSLHLAGLLLVIASCGKDEAVMPAGAEVGQALTISIIDSGHASAEGPATRTVEDGNRGKTRALTRPMPPQTL